MKVLEESESRINAKMKNFGEDVIRRRPQHEISVEDYLRFFDKKWVAIADCLGLEYKQHVKDDWVHFTVAVK